MTGSSNHFIAGRGSVCECADPKGFRKLASCPTDASVRDARNNYPHTRKLRFIKELRTISKVQLAGGFQCADEARTLAIFAGSKRGPKTQRIDAYSGANSEAAALILADVEGFGGADSLPVRWARLVVERQQPEQLQGVLFGTEAANVLHD